VAVNTKLNPQEVTDVCKFLLKNIRRFEGLSWQLSDEKTTFFKKWMGKVRKQVEDEMATSRIELKSTPGQQK
jgi:hypothetical protein